MSGMKNLMVDIFEDIDSGLYSFAEIAKRHDVPISWVDEVYKEMIDELGLDDSMDGDAASALASVGWGTDEDYGYTGDYE